MQLDPFHAKNDTKPKKHCLCTHHTFPCFITSTKKASGCATRAVPCSWTPCCIVVSVCTCHTEYWDVYQLGRRDRLFLPRAGFPETVDYKLYPVFLIARFEIRDRDTYCFELLFSKLSRCQSSFLRRQLTSRNTRYRLARPWNGCLGGVPVDILDWTVFSIQRETEKQRQKRGKCKVCLTCPM